MMLIPSVASSAFRPVRLPAWSMPMKSMALIVPSPPLLSATAWPFTNSGKLTAAVPLTGTPPMPTETVAPTRTHCDWVLTAWGNPLPSAALFADEMPLIVSTSEPSKNVSSRQPVTRMVSVAATPAPLTSEIVPLGWLMPVI